VFCGSFTAKDFSCEVSGGKLKILTEGKVRKFVDMVNQITFSGDYSRKAGQPVFYVTERAVFTLKADGVHLLEIAPGVRLEEDILAHMDFKPIIDPGLKEMDKEIFS
jgi:propionate CoA-transferase